MITNEIYAEVKHQHCTRSRDVLINHSYVGCARLDSSLPPITTMGGGLVCQLVGKSDILSDNFESKQSSDSIDLPSSCHPFPWLTTFAFGSSEVRRILLEFDPYGGTDPLGMFPPFLRGQMIFWLRVSAQCDI